MIRLLQLSIQNFRGFGPTHDVLNLDADLTLIFGPNGYGKTSIAEAIEWLFYNVTKRRQRGETYSRSEYAGCYANVHGGHPTQVDALVDLDGREVRLARRLTLDDASITLVDGVRADFSTVGIIAIEAMYPVVAQHSLQSFVHSRPKDRRDAICAAFGLEELTALKTALDSARTSFQRSPPGAVITARRELAANATELAKIPACSPLAARWRQVPLLASPGDLPELLKAAEALTQQACPSPETALTALRESRQRASRMVFNADLLRPTNEHHASLETFDGKSAEAKAAFEGVERGIAAMSASMTATYSALILDFWETGLVLAPDGDVCPMCEAQTLDETRRQELRRRLDAGAAVVTSNAALATATQAAKTANEGVAISLKAMGVPGLNETAKARLRELFAALPDLIETFLKSHNDLLEARAALNDAQTAIETFIDGCVARLKVPENMPAVVAEAARLRDEFERAAKHLPLPFLDYSERWLSFKDRLSERIASSDLVSRIDAVGKAIARAAQIELLVRYSNSLEETQTLLRKVESEIIAKQETLLTTRGSEVNDYYKKLSGNSEVGFDTMEPSTDNIRLHATSYGRRMSAAANLSECQLNCLGISVWLMRANTTASPFGFILLDDPVQSMDDAHNEAFIAEIVPHLLDDHQKQVIILSHTQALTDRIRDLNPERQVRTYHIENYERSGPTITEQIRLRMLLSDIKASAKSNERNRKYAIDRIRVLAEHIIRELHLAKLGVPTPVEYDRASASVLLPLFRSIPGTTPQEHAGLRDTCDFSDPAHHTEVGYTVPVRSNIDPHISRLEQLIAKHALIKS